MFKLVIEDDEGNKTVVPVIRDEITIGREEGNTIRLTERNVSRQHARLVREDDAVVVHEISARYGTKKNGEKIAGESRFTVGDVVTIGDYRLTLEGETAESDKTPTAAPAAEEDKKQGFASAPTAITKRDDIERRASQGTEIIPAMPAKLIVVSSNFAGQEFPLNHKEVVIGRADECDIIVDHRSVSQTHAKVVREANGNYKIVDLNSKNGVKVSGEEYRAVHLKRGDVIELGHVRFRFVEPGENYIFTPQSVDDGDYDIAPPAGDSSKNAIIIGGAVVGAVLLAVIAFFVMNNDGADQPKPDPTPIASTNGTPTKTPTAVVDDKVQQQIEKAQRQLKEGKPERAIADLTTARDVLTPTKEERNTIDEMLSQARREKPLEEHLDDGRDYYREERYVDALSKFKLIPPEPPSEIHRIMTEEDLPKKAMTKILSEAGAALEEGEKEEALTLVDEVLLYDPQHVGAQELKTKIASSTAVAVKDPVRNSKPRSKPKAKDLTGDQKDQRMQEGQKALLAGDWKKAINACKPVKDGKCYRIMGVAYQKLGKTEKSCSYFKRAGTTPADCE